MLLALLIVLSYLLAGLLWGRFVLNPMRRSGFVKLYELPVVILFPGWALTMLLAPASILTHWMEWWLTILAFALRGRDWNVIAYLFVKPVATIRLYMDGVEASSQAR